MKCTVRGVGLTWLCFVLHLKASAESKYEYNEYELTVPRSARRLWITEALISSNANVLQAQYLRFPFSATLFLKLSRYLVSFESVFDTTGQQGSSAALGLDIEAGVMQGCTARRYYR